MDPPLLSEEKLALLQAADPRRRWNSLDDERVCVLCERTITGREIQVFRAPQGSCTLRCPTEGCPSLPSDWFYHGSACSTTNGSEQRRGEVTLWAT